MFIIILFRISRTLFWRYSPPTPPTAIFSTPVSPNFEFSSPSPLWSPVCVVQLVLAVRPALARGRSSKGHIITELTLWFPASPTAPTVLSGWWDPMPTFPGPVLGSRCSGCANADTVTEFKCATALLCLEKNLFPWCYLSHQALTIFSPTLL